MLWPEGEHLLFKPGVPSLADLCLDYVADCFQQLEGLDRLPVTVRQQVFVKLSRSQKINDMTLSLFLTANSKGACPFVELDFSSMKWVSASTVIQLFNPYTLLHLNLSNCTQITDEVVQAITKESRILETLIVSNNPNIMDPIKHECPCLLAVDLRSTKLKDEALCALARLCTSLVKVDIRGCNEVRWGGLRALERHCPSLLSLHYDYVVYPPTGSSDRSKLDFTQLRELGIYWDTDYKDMIYALIHANRGLRSLACQAHRQDGTVFDVDHLSDLPELEELRLAQCTLEGTAIVSRTLRSMFLHDVWRFPAKPIITFDCPRLTHISWTAQTTRLFPACGNLLRGCPNLFSLSVTAYPFDMDFFEELKHHTSLNILAITSSPINFAELESSSLRTLVLVNAYFQKDVTVMCPALEYVRLESCTNHAHLRLELPSLQKAEIIKPLGSHNTPMVDAILEFVEDLARRCPLLKILTLQSLPKDYYSTRDLKIVSASLLKLEITGGTYPTLRDILNCDCPQLIALNLRESNIDNFNLDAILRNCPRLHSLDVTECKQLTASRKLGSLRQLRVLKAHKTNLELGCVLDVLKRCGRLQTVEYSRCHNVVPVSREEAELKKIEEDIKEEAPIEVFNSCLRRLVIDSSFADLHLYALNLASLHTLHFSHTHMLRDHHIAQLVAHSPRLRHLSLFSCASLHQPQFVFPDLLVLNLVSCDSMTRPKIQCPALQLVDIKFCTVDGAVVTSMLADCPRLITLNLLNLGQLVGPLTLDHGSLQKLAMSSCERVSRLRLSLPALKQVELMALPALTAVLFLRPSPQLLRFGLVFCQRVDAGLLQRELADKAESAFVQLIATTTHSPSSSSSSSSSSTSILDPSAFAPAFATSAASSSSSSGGGPLSTITSSLANLSSSLDHFASTLFPPSSSSASSPSSSPSPGEGGEEEKCLLM